MSQIPSFLDLTKALTGLEAMMSRSHADLVQIANVAFLCKAASGQQQHLHAA